MEINSEVEYEQALYRIQKLGQTGLAKGSPEEVEFDTLIIAVEAYERIHYPMGKPNSLTGALKQISEEVAVKLAEQLNSIRIIKGNCSSQLINYLRSNQP